MNTKRSKRMLAIYCQKFQNLEFVAKKIHVKTLIISGKNDYIVTPKIAYTFHKIINESELIEIDGATHFAHIEAPYPFFKKLQEFLNTK